MEHGAEIGLKALSNKPEYSSKVHSRDVATETDKVVERLLVRGIRKQFPDHQIVAEEGTEGASKSMEITDAPTWIIDPIAGTMNFIRGFPNFCTSIALYVDKKASWHSLPWPLEPVMPIFSLDHNFGIGQQVSLWYKRPEVIIDPCGGDFDIQSQRILAASTLELAEQFVPILSQLFPAVDKDYRATRPTETS
ncbi:hypothetical protein ACLKA6_011047 [Drosophila palustris]